MVSVKGDVLVFFDNWGQGFGHLQNGLRTAGNQQKERNGKAADQTMALFHGEPP